MKLVTREINLSVESLVLDSNFETLEDWGHSCTNVRDRFVLCVLLKVQECNKSLVVNINPSFGLSTDLYLIALCMFVVDYFLCLVESKSCVLVFILFITCCCCFLVCFTLDITSFFVLLANPREVIKRVHSSWTSGLILVFVLLCSWWVLYQPWHEF